MRVLCRDMQIEEYLQCRLQDKRPATRRRKDGHLGQNKNDALRPSHAPAPGQSWAFLTLISIPVLHRQWGS